MIHVSYRQTLAIAALLEFRTQEEAASAAGVSRRTLTRWLRSPEFRQRLQVAASDVLELTQVRMASGTAIALKTLQDEMRTGSPGIRVRAALGWLQHAREIGLENLQERLDQLEAELNT